MKTRATPSAAVIVDAIESHDPDAARAIMRHHLSEIDDAMRQAAAA